jgi:hypothetical protein
LIHQRQGAEEFLEFFIDRVEHWRSGWRKGLVLGITHVRICITKTNGNLTNASYLPLSM